jgi:hypothetical protein
MEFKGTKGEWTVENLSDSNSLFIECDGKVVGTVWNNFEIEKEANAQLITTAPKMIEFLIELYEDKETHSGMFPSQQKKLKELINQATKID